MRELGLEEFVSVLEKGLGRGEAVSFDGIVRLHWHGDKVDDEGYVPSHDILEYNGHSRLTFKNEHYSLSMNGVHLFFEKREEKVSFMNEEGFQKQLSIPISVKDREYYLNIDTPENIFY